jgi:hypothetical protein
MLGDDPQFPFAQSDNEDVSDSDTSNSDSDNDSESSDEDRIGDVEAGNVTTPVSNRQLLFLRRRGRWFDYYEHLTTGMCHVLGTDILAERRGNQCAMNKHWQQFGQYLIENALLGTLEDYVQFVFNMTED